MDPEVYSRRLFGGSRGRLLEAVRWPQKSAAGSDQWTQRVAPGSLSDGTQALSLEKSLRRRPHSSAFDGGLRETNVRSCPWLGLEL